MTYTRHELASMISLLTLKEFGDAANVTIEQEKVRMVFDVKAHRDLMLDYIIDHPELFPIRTFCAWDAEKFHLEHELNSIQKKLIGE